MKAAEDEVSSASQRESAEDNAGTIEEQRRTIKEDIKAKKQKLQEVKVSDGSYIANKMAGCARGGLAKLHTFN